MMNCQKYLLSKVPSPSLWGVILVILLATLLVIGGVCPSGTFAEESRLEVVTPAAQVADCRVREAIQSDSEKNLDGGYNAHQAVIDRFAAMRYRYTGGRYQNEPILFRLHKPDHPEEGKRYPLIVWLHGAGEGDMTNTRQLSHMQWGLDDFTGPGSEDCYILATQCPPDNKSWTTSLVEEGRGDSPLAITDEILEELLRTEPIDRSRIGLFGICSGASGAWEYAARRPDLFAAMVLCSSSPPHGPFPSRYRGTAVWAFNNKDDTGSDYRDMIPWIDSLNQAGGNAFATVRKSGGHNSWTPALKEGNALAWLLTQNREKSSPPPGVLCPSRSRTDGFLLFGLPLLGLAVLGGIRWGRRIPRLVWTAFRRPAASFLFLLGVSLLAVILGYCGNCLKTYYFGETRLVRHRLSFDYLLHLPPKYLPFGDKRPLIIFLHGAGETGQDVSCLARLDLNHYVTSSIAVNDYPFITVSPITPIHGWKPERVVAFLDELLTDPILAGQIDESRIYLTGFSMGGFGTFATAAQYPDRFAAIVPLAGGIDSTKAKKLVSVPIWAFHGDADSVVPYAESKEIIDALQNLPGSEARLTTLANADHGIPPQVYDRPELYQWLLNHRRK